MSKETTANLLASIVPAVGFVLTALYFTVAHRYRLTWKIGVVLMLICSEIILAPALQPGTWYWVFIACSYLVVGLSCYFLAQLINRSHDRVMSSGNFEQKISEYKHAQKILQRYQLLSQNARDIILFIRVRDGQILEANRAAVQTYGYEQQDILTKNIRDLRAAELRHMIDSQLDQANIGGVFFETIHQRKDGSTFPVEISSMGMTLDDERVTLSIVRNITERKKMEQDLLLTQFCVDQASIGILRTGSDAQILDVNQKSCQMLGYTAEELCNLHIYDIDPDFPLDRWVEHRSHIRHHGTDTFETFHRRKDGSMVPVEITTTHIIFQGDEFSFSFIRDITERKHAEAVIKENEVRLQQAIRVANIGIYDHDHLADTLYWNSEQRKNYGWGRKKIPSLPKLLEQIHPDDLNATVEAVKRAHNPVGDGLFDVEYRIIRRDGQTRSHVTRSQTFFEGEGNARHPVRTFGAEIDITERKRAEESVEMFQYSIDQSMDAVFWMTADAGFSYVNEQACRSLGYTREELMQLKLWDIDPIYPKETWYASWEQYQEQRHGGDQNVETLHRRKDGTVFPVEVSSKHLWFGEQELHVAIVRDITERRQAEAQVMLQATALESAANGIMIIDRDGKIIWANSSLAKMTGYSTNELIGKSPAFIRKVSPEDNAYEKLWRAVKKGTPWHGEVSNMRKDGYEFIAEMTITPVTNEPGQVTHYISICNDISEKIQAREKLEYLATHDTLTGLPNRLLFSDRLAHALTMANRTDSQGAVLLIDMDDFKAINDAFSHDDGDEFLKLMAGRFNECLRESDTVARIGGDEFAILLENIDPEDAGLVAQKINRVLSEPVEIRGNIIVSTASIGISIFPQDGDAIQILLKNADLAMYRAKEDRNSFQSYTPEMGARVKEHMELTTYLRYALQNDIFQLHYQPQVNAETGKVFGLEALLRLPHPTKKWISPNEFIPLAEKTGLITLIDEWVLRVASKKMKGLLDSGFREITMSVNISSRQLGQSNLYNILDTVLKENDLDPGYLELEISENSVFQNTKDAITTLTKLKAMGLKLAIDDFGTGYASLNYLANFPLDTLKIDLSFTKKILSSKGDAAIVTGVIAIANSLGLDIIVEGVEKKEQLGFFSDLGCHLIQGYFFSPAVPDSETNKMLNTGFVKS